MAASDTEGASPGETPGLWAHLSSLVAAKLAYLRARLELAGLEGKEAAIHLTVVLVLALAGLIVAIFGYLFFVLALVFLIAQAFGGGNAWIWVLGSVALAHFVVAALLFIFARVKLGAPLFPITLEELKKDQEWLKTNAKTN